MSDHLPDDPHVSFFLRLEVLVHSPFSDFFIRIRGGILQEGLIVLNRVFLAHEGFVQYLEPGLYGDLIFFPLVHLVFLIKNLR